VRRDVVRHDHLTMMYLACVCSEGFDNAICDALFVSIGRSFKFEVTVLSTMILFGIMVQDVDDGIASSIVGHRKGARGQVSNHAPRVVCHPIRRWLILQIGRSLILHINIFRHRWLLEEGIDLPCLRPGMITLGDFCRLVRRMQETMVFAPVE
jgi:hypothetical protein